MLRIDKGNKSAVKFSDLGLSQESFFFELFKLNAKISSNDLNRVASEVNKLNAMFE
jgi:hypothetical protein